MWNRLSFVFIASLSARCLWCVSIGRFVDPSLLFVRTREGYWMSTRRALTAGERRSAKPREAERWAQASGATSCTEAQPAWSDRTVADFVRSGAAKVSNRRGAGPRPPERLGRAAAVPLDAGVRCGDGHQHQEQREDEGPHRGAIRAGDEGARRGGTTARRRCLARDLDGAASGHPGREPQSGGAAGRGRLAVAVRALARLAA